MKFTIDWLQEYTSTEGTNPSELAEHLTMAGLEVDSVTDLYPELDAFKTAKVVSVSKHPDADKLTLCQVDNGEEVIQVVCGAPNVREGLATVIALPGTIMPSGMKIKKSKVRGVQSFGMLCSENELGLSDNQSGIMELDDTTAPGLTLRQALSLDDTLIEIDLTPNRPDCASVIGIAREVAAITKHSISLPVEQAEITKTSKDFEIVVESPELCPRYAARLIRNVTIKQSPWWLRKRLLSVGLRPINNVVDITNLVMLEYGQPLHAFDFQTLAGRKIVVRTPSSKERKFTTLDNTERVISSDTLMICDGEKPVAVAGVMGGTNSEVTESTTDVLLESACFNPISIRKTARELNLATDASYRFERGVDPEGVVRAAERAVNLICKLSGGTAVNQEGSDSYEGRKPRKTLELSVPRTSELIGMDLDHEKISTLLQAIEFPCKKKDDKILLVGIPSFRVDIEREADLVEEVARLIGYNNIPTTLPSVDLSYPEQDSDRKKRAEAINILASIGFSEAINYSFSSEKHVQMIMLDKDDQRCQLVRLLNPLSEEQSVMRSMLLPGLLENIKRNISYQKTSIKLFEMGKVFTPTGEHKQPIERNRLCGVLSGNRYGQSSPYHYKRQEIDILDVKGAVEYLLEALQLSGNNIKNSSNFHIPSPDEVENYASQQQSLMIKSGSTVLGYLGKIKNKVTRNFNIKQDVFFFDIDYDAVCATIAPEKSFKPLWVYPAIKRDIALLVPTTISAGELLATIESSGERLIEHCEIFDVYQGEKIQSGLKSIAISVTYRSEKKTLTEKNVEKAHQKIVRLLTKAFDGSFREA